MGHAHANCGIFRFAVSCVLLHVRVATLKFQIFYFHMIYGVLYIHVLVCWSTATSMIYICKHILGGKRSVHRCLRSFSAFQDVGELEDVVLEYVFCTGTRRYNLW